jgi:ABC-type multidrug transport system ATPase subunit
MSVLDGTTAVAVRGDLFDARASSSPVIEVDGLNVVYGDFHAVKDLSFHVERGELYALLGTNGAGKTSALEVIEGHRQAWSGTVRVFDGSPTDRRAVRPRMGMMLQESGFSHDLSVSESVGLIGRLTGRSDTVERVLEVVDLTGKAHTRVSQLSGGEKRRLDFATAVYGRPELLILDEPTMGLDIQSRDAVWAAVEQLREEGATVILTTHYLEEAQQRADRIGLMHDGTLRAHGTVAELTRALPSSISTPIRRPREPLRMGAAVFAIARSELVQILRNRAVLVTSLVMPMAASIYFISFRDDFEEMGSLGYIGALLVFTIGAFSLYATTVTTLAARRQNLFLKRLRSTAASDPVILSGLMLPISVISLVQVTVILGVFGAVSGSPADVALLAVSVASAFVMMLALGLATAGVTRSPEHAQVTTLPLSLGIVAVASWVGIAGTENLTLLKRLLPGGSAAELVVDSWNGGVPRTESLLLLAPTLAWVVVAIALATKLFRWEPRR